MAAEKKKMGLVAQLVIAIVLGALIGAMDFIPEFMLRIPVTFSRMFGNFLSFVIPVMIIGFVVAGISNLTQNIGRLIGNTVGLSYLSLLGAGLMTFGVGQVVFPHFIKPVDGFNIEEVPGLEPLVELPMEPFFGVTEAIVFSFMIGIAISMLSRRNEGQNIKALFEEFEQMIFMVLNGFVIPLLPYYIFGNFLNLSYSGQIAQIMKSFSVVLALTFVQHFIYTFILFGTASGVSGKSFGQMIKNQIPAYLTAFGTQSSAATIPVNLESAFKNKVSRPVAEFVVPLGATIHLPGSMISVSSTVLGVLLMNGMDNSAMTFLPFMVALGLLLVAAPGVPGGAIMASLPLLTMVGIDPDGRMAALLITLYVTQDSFGTAINVSGDNALAVIVDTLNKRRENK